MQKTVDWKGWISAAKLKVMLYVEWDHLDITHSELLNRNQTLNTDL